MHIDQLYPSRFLKCSDLDGKAMRVTVAALKKEDVGGEAKVVMSFTNGTKALILNKTNARSIAKVHGDETKNWVGKDITLVPAQVDFRGDIVDAIRVRTAPPKSSRPVEPAPDEDSSYDDDYTL
jgi:hypothetical protein